MKYIFIPFLFVSFFCFSQNSQGEMQVITSCSVVEGPLPKPKIKDKLPDYYINPKGNWRSTSGSKFFILPTQEGFLYQNLVYGDRFVAYSTTSKNIFATNYYYDSNRTQYAFTYYYTIVDENTIRVNKSTGEEFTWSKY